jgi:hypothetical protein
MKNQNLKSFSFITDAVIDCNPNKTDIILDEMIDAILNVMSKHGCELIGGFSLKPSTDHSSDIYSELKQALDAHRGLLH